VNERLLATEPTSEVVEIDPARTRNSVPESGIFQGGVSAPRVVLVKFVATRQELAVIEASEYVCVAYLTFDRLPTSVFPSTLPGGANLGSCRLGDMYMSLFGRRSIKLENTEPTWLDIALSGDYLMIAAGIVVFLLIAGYSILLF
jgi:hypothetical protein